MLTAVISLSALSNKCSLLSNVVFFNSCLTATFAMLLLTCGIPCQFPVFSLPLLICHNLLLLQLQQYRFTVIIKEKLIKNLLAKLSAANLTLLQLRHTTTQTRTHTHADSSLYWKMAASACGMWFLESRQMRLFSIADRRQKKVSSTRWQVFFIGIDICRVFDNPAACRTKAALIATSTH